MTVRRGPELGARTVWPGLGTVMARAKAEQSRALIHAIIEVEVHPRSTQHAAHRTQYASVVKETKPRTSMSSVFLFGSRATS